MPSDPVSLKARRSLWRVERNAVTRAGVVIATILHSADGEFGWRGLGIERVGFTNMDELLRDVKYFYRYQPRTILTFRSGRTITLG